MGRYHEPVDSTTTESVTPPVCSGSDRGPVHQAAQLVLSIDRDVDVAMRRA